MDDAHPQYPYHIVIANFLMKVWTIQVELAIKSSNNKYTSIEISSILPPPMHKEKIRITQAACSDIHNVYIGLESNVTWTSISGDWKRGGDMIGNNKPGWWIDSTTVMVAL